MSTAGIEHRIAESAQLHERVRAFAVDMLPRRVGTTFDRERFEALACDVASFQAGQRRATFEQVVSNAVPADCFKFGTVFQFPPAEAVCSFRTSGTTANTTGVHYFRDVQSYEQLSLAWGAIALDLEREPAPVIVALAPWTGLCTSSSLGYMMQRLMERFDGRSVCERRVHSEFRLDDPLRWLVSEKGVDVDGLIRVASTAALAKTRVVVLATSFALVELLDALGERVSPLPSGSIVMPTGGFKGRTRTIEPDQMQRELYRIFGDVDLVGEYGMTELTSQLYEGTARYGELEHTNGIYLEPAWLRVVPCDPVTLEPVSEGRTGLACFVDLGNVDSAVAVLTQDLVRREGSGIRLLGRRPTAPLRGCSLAIEALLRPMQPNQPALKVARHVTDVQESTELVDSAKARVFELVDAAIRCKRALLGSSTDLVQLAASSFMSVEGVKLALDLALETTPTSQEVDELVAAARRDVPIGDEGQPTVWVVLSSTVFTAAHRAVALASSLSARVKVKASRRQPHFARALNQVGNGLFELVEDIAPAQGDIVMVFGSDETIDAVRASLPHGVTLRGYGHGMGVAVVTFGADLASCAADLALDIVLFEQQGCLSPRLLLIDSLCDAREFVQMLSEQLFWWNERVPVGSQGEAHLSHAAWERRIAQTFATVTPCGPGWIARYSAEWCSHHRLPLSSAPRSISMVQANNWLELLTPLANQVTCVGFAGSDAAASELAQALPMARHVPLGMMQRPRFDGAVDRR